MMTRRGSRAKSMGRGSKTTHQNLIEGQQQPTMEAQQPPVSAPNQDQQEQAGASRLDAIPAQTSGGPSKRLLRREQLQSETATAGVVMPLSELHALNLEGRHHQQFS